MIINKILNYLNLQDLKLISDNFIFSPQNKHPINKIIP